MRARGHGNRYEQRHGQANRNRACARRVADQQCAVAGFVALEPWVVTPSRRRWSLLRREVGAIASCGHEGLHLGGARSPVH